MIWESHFWKTDLLKRAASLMKRQHQKRWLEVSLARLKQDLMLGFYSIRRLIESKKLSDSTVSQQVPITVFLPSGKRATLLNWHKVDEIYNLDSGQSVTRTVGFLCNQFIHSYIFLPAFGKDGMLASIIVASDYERNRRAYEITLHQIIDLFEQVGSDYPNEVQFRFNPDKQDYDVTSTMHVGGDWA